MLFAGAGANNISVFGGALTFVVGDAPSATWLDLGSANMLLAGAGVSDPSVTVGALTFAVGDSPLAPGWSYGSAEKHIGLY